MANIFPIDFEEKLTMAQDDYILFSDSEDWNKIKKAQYKNLKGEKGDTWPAWKDGTDGKDWTDWTAATITVGSTTTWPAWSSASVVNSWTSSAAVLDFTIPKWDKWDTGQTWPAIVSAAFNWNDIDFTEEDWNVVTLTDAKIDLKWDKWDAATVSVWTTTTLPAWSSAAVTNSWTSSAAVFNFWIPKGDKWDTWNTWATWNWIASITSSKNWKITTVTITETNSTVDTFQISDWEDWQWSGDVNWPASSTDWDVVVFDWTTWKAIKDWSVALSTLSSAATLASTAIQPWDDISDLNNDSGFITWITSGDVTTALWYTPADSASLGTAATKDTWTSSWNVPVLDSNWKLNKSTLPGVALTDTYTVSTSSDLTSLSSAEQWDLAIVTTESKTYVLATEPYSTAANWKEILSPTGWVTSVNSQTWAVTLDADDISDSTTTNKFVTASDKSTWSGKQDALVSWTNIKTINNNSILGSGDLSLYSTITVTLTTAWWSSSTQTVSATGVTASNTVIVSPNPSDYSDYTDAEIYCSAQGSGTLTFTCGTTPSNDIDVNVVILN